MTFIVQPTSLLPFPFYSSFTLHVKKEECRERTNGFSYSWFIHVVEAVSDFFFLVSESVRDLF